MGFKIKPSISKIDVGLYLDSSEYLFYKINDVFDSFKKYIEMRITGQDPNYVYYKQDIFHFYIYNYGHEVEWKEFIESVMGKPILNEISFSTNYPSYILLINIGENIFCITGGLANHLYSEFKDKMFGVNILSKIVESSDEIIRHFADKRVYGRRNSLRVTNRSSSNFLNETNYESVFGEFGTSINIETQKKLGINTQKETEEGSQERDIYVIFGSSIQIGKQVELSEIKDIVTQIEHLCDDTVPFKFVINFLVQVDKIGIKQTEIFDEFFKKIKDCPEDINIGYNYEVNNLISINCVRNSNGSVIKESFIQKYGLNSIENLKDLQRLIVEYVKENKSISIVKDYYLKFDSGDYEKSKVKMRELLDQEFLYKESLQVYLIEGVWYKFLDDYAKFLNDKYLVLYNKSIELCDKLFQEIEIDIKSFKIENELKKIIGQSSKVLDADMRYIKLIEIADAIYIDGHKLYLLHNKTHFNGQGIRDITGQINSSAKIVSQIRNHSFSSEDLFNKYVVSLRIKNPQLGAVVDEFVEKFNDTNTEIIYIAAFTDDVAKDTDSNYIKYLLSTTENQLIQYNIKFYFY